MLLGAVGWCCRCLLFLVYWSVCGCWLVVVGCCVLFVPARCCCLLFVVGVCCLLLFVVDCCCVLCGGVCSLFVVRCLVFVAGCGLSAVCC